MINSFLVCTVRDCGAPLEPTARTLVCAKRHSYDIARSGYVNLLQPQDRRSPSAGDSKAAVEARGRLFEAGVGRPVSDAFVAHAIALALPARAVVVDLGSGCGHTLASLARLRSISGTGIDLSTAAAEHAARRFPTLTWVVANADRFVPVADERVDLVLSQNGRRNPAECQRILSPSGFLLVAVPAEDDLIELREYVQGNALQRDRSDAVLEEHEGTFRLLNRSSSRTRQRLGRESLLDLLLATYRGARASAGARIATLDDLEVTSASDFFLFGRQ